MGNNLGCSHKNTATDPDRKGDKYQKKSKNTRKSANIKLNEK